MSYISSSISKLWKKDHFSKSDPVVVVLEKDEKGEFRVRDQTEWKV